jgi:hypothetical protein
VAELRASDADRERVADVLRHAAGEGRLTVDELDERLNATYASVTRADLERLVEDVPVDGALLPAIGQAAAPVASGVALRPGAEGGSHWILSIMSGADRRGRWRVAPRCNVVSIMGGAELDFNQVELTAPETEVVVFSLMGGADLYVPDGLNVEVSQFAFMGGNDVKLGDAPHVPGAPTLRLKLISIMGGADVKRGTKQSWRERREQRRRERERRHLGH